MVKKIQFNCARRWLLLATAFGVLLLSATACAGQETDSNALMERATTLLSEANTVSDFVSEYDLGGHHIIVSVPIVPTPMFEERLDTIRDNMNSAILSEFEPYSDEPGLILDTFLIHDGDHFCKVEYGCAETEEELIERYENSLGSPEQMILIFTFEDTGETVSMIGPWQDKLADVADLSDDRTSKQRSDWMFYASQQGIDENDWIKASDYAFKTAIITVYSNGSIVDSAKEHRSTLLSAYIVSVIESAMEYLEPITPENYNIDREVTVPGSDYGISIFDLENNLLSVELYGETLYYDLSSMDAQGMTLLHQALYDYDYTAN